MTESRNVVVSLVGGMVNGQGVEHRGVNLV